MLSAQVYQRLSQGTGYVRRITRSEAAELYRLGSEQAKRLLTRMEETSLLVQSGDSQRYILRAYTKYIGTPISYLGVPIKTHCSLGNSGGHSWRSTHGRTPWKEGLSRIVTSYRHIRFARRRRMRPTIRVRFHPLYPYQYPYCVHFAPSVRISARVSVGQSSTHHGSRVSSNRRDRPCSITTATSPKPRSPKHQMQNSGGSAGNTSAKYESPWGHGSLCKISSSSRWAEVFAACAQPRLF
jgi:hypothetical protein